MTFQLPLENKHTLSLSFLSWLMVKKLRNISRNLHVASFVFNWERILWGSSLGKEHLATDVWPVQIFCSMFFFTSSLLFGLFKRTLWFVSFHQSEPTCRTAVQERSDKLRQIAISLRLIMVRWWKYYYVNATWSWCITAPIVWNGARLIVFDDDLRLRWF